MVQFSRDFCHCRSGSSKLDVDTFRRHLKLAALGDLDRLGRLVARALLTVLDLLHDVVALQDLAEDDVAAVEPPVMRASQSPVLVRGQRQNVAKEQVELTRSQRW